MSPAVAACRHTYAGMPVPSMVEPGPPWRLRPRLRAVKSEFFDAPLPRAAIDALVANLVEGHVSGQYRELELVPWGGAFARVPPAGTAFVHRRCRFLVGHHGIAPHTATDPQRAAVRDWVRRSWRTVHPWGSGAVYPNYPDPELPDWSRAYHGANLSRLCRVKARYDPDDVFHYPQSVPLPGRRSAPAGAGAVVA